MIINIYQYFNDLKIIFLKYNKKINNKKINNKISMELLF